MSLAKAYVPQDVEAKWSAFWEENHLFQADATSPKPPFSIVIPPPNVTGVLHMGHALVNTLQDVMVRFKRMDGYEALWVPGTDHAGIATQTVVERHLMETLGKRRSDFSREEFVEHIWAWKEKSEQVILRQIKALGCSCDFSRQRFTMDAGCNRAVRKMFKKFFDAGLIYRGDYLVHWDPVTQTALADDEVEYEEREGFLWTFSYPLIDGSGEVLIATTRPETLFGDTALAVSPKDARHRHLIGKKVRVPFVNREIPILADPFVDPEFGTGVVKITPAHDPNDYKVGLQHNLPMITVMHPNGVMNAEAGPFSGMSREEAREAVVKEMEAMGRLIKRVRHLLRVGLSYRSKAVIEPRLSKQWFVKMGPFIEPLQRAVRDKEVALLPSSWEHTYFHWIDNLRDWCISRQLWWGHRIPVWYHRDDPTRMICAEEEEIPAEVVAHPELWEQDSDVLDTWFSSALWPLSTLGWPDATPDFKKFYPTHVLITGHDILFFWVARMILMGKYATGVAPFPKTFLHGLIYGRSYWRENPQGGITYVRGEEKRQYDLGQPLPRDVSSKWEKLSKSKGNVIDPLDLIHEYGTDAVRMALCSLANQSPQIDLDRRRFEEFKNFANKVWNGARFVLMHLEGLSAHDLETPVIPTLFEDRWIIEGVARVTAQVRTALDSYHFDQAAEHAYRFFWNEFCAYYVEFSKSTLMGDNRALRQQKQQILLFVLLSMIRLLHPMAPFITEELFHVLKTQFGGVFQAHDPYMEDVKKALTVPACALSSYPALKAEAETLDFAHFEAFVYAVRKIRGEMKIPPHMATDIYVVGILPSEYPRLLAALIKIGTFHNVSTPPQLACGAMTHVGELQLHIPLPEALAQQEQERLAKEKIRIEQTLLQLENLLANPEFLAKAKEELITKKREERQALRNELAYISQSK